MAIAALKAVGWKTAGIKPEAPRFVLIAAPHTTNWDLPYMVAAAWAVGTRLRWLGKHTLFAPPHGALFSWLGGIPVRRSERHDMVTRMAELLQSDDEFALVVPPEGTRSATEYWKSGFYHIAREANVPVVMGFLDYKHRVAGFGPSFIPTGNTRADMDQVRAFYADKAPKYPEKFLRPQLREESEEVETRQSA